MRWLCVGKCIRTSEVKCGKAQLDTPGNLTIDSRLQWQAALGTMWRGRAVLHESPSGYLDVFVISLSF